MTQISSSIVAFAVVTLSLSGCDAVLGPQSYDECVLEQMKGQDQRMIHTASRLCERRFPYEKEIAAVRRDFDISWNYISNSEPRVTVRRVSGDYRPTQAHVHFFETCDEAARGGEEVWIALYPTSQADVYRGVGERLPEDQYNCMRTLRVQGILEVE